MSSIAPTPRDASLIMPLPRVDLSGRVAIVTGANQGVGLGAAKHIARLSASRLILACRNLAAGAAAVKIVLDSLETGSKGKTSVECWHLDLADFKSVKAFADKADKELDRLDVVIANAAVAPATKVLTVDGLDQCLQVNNIANSYLLHRLLPLIKRSRSDTAAHFKPHITLVSSGAYRSVQTVKGTNGRGVLATLLAKGDGEAYDQMYAVSKLLNVLDTKTIASLAGDGIIVSAVSPGLCPTNLSRDQDEAFKANLREMQAKMGWSAEMGSRVVVWAATEDIPSGSYVRDCVAGSFAGFAATDEGEEAGRELWDEYERIWRDKGLLSTSS